MPRVKEEPHKATPLQRGQSDADASSGVEPPHPAAAAGTGTSQKRKAPAAVNDDSSSKAAASSFNKGLRHFSMRLCKKVEEKVMTTFNEVADEIVAEFAREGAALALAGNHKPSKSHSEKNIRRRVYDALNVLMAMGVITKVKKQITWKGLPSNTRRDLDMTERQIQEKRQSIAEKRQHLEELLVQSISYRNVVERNKRSKTTVNPEEKIPIPFIIVNTAASTRVELEISENQSDVFFDFNEPFEIHDYSEVLRRMGMHRVDEGAGSGSGGSSGNSSSSSSSSSSRSSGGDGGGGGGGVSGSGTATAAAAAAGDVEARKELLRGIVPEHLVKYVPDSVFEEAGAGVTQRAAQEPPRRQPPPPPQAVKQEAGVAEQASEPAAAAAPAAETPTNP